MLDPARSIFEEYSSFGYSGWNALNKDLAKIIKKHLHLPLTGHNSQVYTKEDMNKIKHYLFENGRYYSREERSKIPHFEKMFNDLLRKDERRKFLRHPDVEYKDLFKSSPDKDFEYVGRFLEETPEESPEKAPEKPPEKAPEESPEEPSKEEDKDEPEPKPIEFIPKKSAKPIDKETIKEKTEHIKRASSEMAADQAKIRKTQEEIFNAGSKVADRQDKLLENQKAIVEAISQPKKKGLKELIDEFNVSDKPPEKFLDSLDKDQYTKETFDDIEKLRKYLDKLSFNKNLSTVARYGSIPDDILDQMASNGEISSDQLLSIQDAKNKYREYNRRERLKDLVLLEPWTARRDRKIRLIDHDFNPALLKRP